MYRWVNAGAGLGVMLPSRAEMTGVIMLVGPDIRYCSDMAQSSDDVDAEDLLHEEAHWTAMAQGHQNITGLRGCTTVCGCFALVLELANGGDLQKQMEQRCAHSLPSC